MKSIKKNFPQSFLALAACIAITIASGFNGFVSAGETVKPADLSPLEQGVLEELNKARTNPKAYAQKLREYLKYYSGTLLKIPGEIAIRTNEGPAAVEEAIRFLEAASPLPPFVASRGMSRAAKDHVRQQGPSGRTGHNGNDGSSPFSRMNRYGQWQMTAGENIDYGNDKADRIVMSLIIDDGVSGRGHRENIFNGAFRIVGIACGPHQQYRHMCVIGFAGGYVDK